MSEILLTHGFFLAEDEVEQRVMRPYPPLGLLYLAAYLRQRGVETEVFDSTFRGVEQFPVHLTSDRTTVVGIYTTHMTRRRVVTMIRQAKHAGRRVVLGGPDGMSFPREYFDCGADVIVAGEGEATLSELLPALARVGPTRLGSVAGVIFRDERGEIVHTAPRAHLPIDTIPWPDREAIDIQAYLEAWSRRHGVTSLNVITGRGCPYACTWCSHPVFGRSHRQRDAADVADEVRELSARYKPDQVWYADDVFTLDSRWVMRFAQELDARGVRVPFETVTRADRLESDELVRTLAQIGCTRLWIGSESGSDRVLRQMNRGVTATQIRQAIRRAKAHGISVGVFVMWGYEGESLADIEETVAHVVECQPDQVLTTMVYPSRGTEYYRSVEADLSLPAVWAESSDRDVEVRGRPSRAYYRLADRWLRAALEARALGENAPESARAKHAEAEEARRQMELTNS
jgi:anaerobic magnesium-protoporphyrin IX monomethyl ester cyclase